MNKSVFCNGRIGDSGCRVRLRLPRSKQHDSVSALNDRPVRFFQNLSREDESSLVNDPDRDVEQPDTTLACLLKVNYCVLTNL